MQRVQESFGILVPDLILCSGSGFYKKIGAKKRMRVPGTIRGMSQCYVSGLERMYIAIDRRNAGSLPYQDNQRIEIVLIGTIALYLLRNRDDLKDSIAWARETFNRVTRRKAPATAASSNSSEE